MEKKGTRGSRVLRYIGLLAIVVVGLATIVATGGGGGGSSSGISGGTGSVALYVADAPADDYEHLYIWVTEVSLIPSSSGVPVPIFKTDKTEDGYKGLKIDLLEYGEEDFLFTVKRGVPAKQYAKIRLEVSHVEAVAKEKPDPACAELEIKLPSGRIDLNPRDPFWVRQGVTLRVRLDMDVNKSINLHEAGKSGKCIFRPVVFVDINESAPIERCPKIVSGSIRRLIYENGKAVGLILDLSRDRGALDVLLFEDTAVFDSQGECGEPGDLRAGMEVKVRGKLNAEGALDASLVVVGGLIEVTGTVTSTPDFDGADSTFSFQLELAEGQALIGERTVEGLECTLTLIGCDTYVDPAMIEEGMVVRLFGKELKGDIIRSAAIILYEREIIGTITGITEMPDSDDKIIRVLEADGSALDVTVRESTPAYLEGDGKIPIHLLCVEQKVRIPLIPASAAEPPEARIVWVESMRNYGTVISVNKFTRQMRVQDDAGNYETVYVHPGATVLQSREDDGEQRLLSGLDIRPYDSVVYFGLRDCFDSGFFHAFVVIVRD